MVSKLCGYILLFIFFGATQAYDPFESEPDQHCMTCRPITGCNETFLEVYKRTLASKDDRNINEPDTRVYLFTRCNKQYPECLHDCGGRLPLNTVYRARRNSVIIIGALHSTVCSYAYYREMKDQLLYRASYNVILIDWYWAVGFDFHIAALNTEVVGKQVALLIQNIMEQTGVSGDKFHIIGHDQGAHAAGFAGKYLKCPKSVKCCKLRRITGLDPTGLTFVPVPLNKKLNPSDAKLVDVIHAGAGECFPFAFGTALKTGHVDFYPNGGSIQLSCFPLIFESFIKLDVIRATLALYPAVCNLYQSLQYFMMSINACQCQFIGVKCNSYEDFESGRCRSCGKDGSRCAVMGMDLEYYPYDKGNHSYYLHTDLKCPYCNNDGINIEGFPKHPTCGNRKPHCFDPKS